MAARIIKLQADGTEIPYARNGTDISITNGAGVAGQYVSGATLTNGATSYTRGLLPVAGDFDITDLDLTGIPGTGPFLTVSGNVLGRATATTSPVTGVTPNPTSGFIPLGQGMNSNFINSAISQTTDTLLTFDATIHHDQGGRDFNIYPTGVLADFITNPTNYDFSVVTSSTTNGTEGFTEIIFDVDVVTSGSTVTIENVAAAVAFTQAQITTIRIGTVVPVASGLANFTGLTSWSTTANSVVFVFNDNANALLADAAFSQIQARLTVTSTVETIQVAAYNANGEGMLAAFLDGRLAEGDRVRFTQRVANLETHLRISTDVVNIDEHLIVDGPTSLNGTVNFGSRVTVPEPTDRADAARFEDTWLAAIESSGFPQGASRRLSVGGQTNVEVVQLIAVEGAGGIQTWYAYLGVEINSAGTGFGIAFESVVYSTHSTNPFAEGTSTTNAPINILGTSDNDFIRDITVRGDARIGDELTVVGDTSLADLTTTRDVTITGGRDTAQNLFTGFVDGTGARIDADTTAETPGIVIPANVEYRAYGFDDGDNLNAFGIDGFVVAVPPSGVTIPAGNQVPSFGGTPLVNGSAVVSIVVGSLSFENLPVAGTITNLSEGLADGAAIFIQLTQAQVDVLEAANEGTDLMIVGTGADADSVRTYFTANQVELYASATIPTLGNVTVGGDLTVTGDIDTTNEFTDFPAETVGELISGVTYQAIAISDSTDLSDGSFSFIVDATTQAGIAALTPWEAGDQITAYFPDTGESASMSVVLLDGSTGLLAPLGSRRRVLADVNAAGLQVMIRASTPSADLVSGVFTGHYIENFRIFNSPLLPRAGDLTVGNNLQAGNLTTIDITAAGELNGFPINALEKASLFLGTRGTATTASLTFNGVASTVLTVTPYTTGGDTRYFYSGVALNAINALVTGRGVWSTSATAPTLTNSINLIG